MRGRAYMQFIFVVLLAILPDVAYAQSPIFKHYTTENGMPSSETYRVLQDRKGYIWIASDGGVARFDGNSFKTYTTKDGLCDNTILHIFEDGKGRIWCYSFAGKFSYFYNDSIYNLRCNETQFQNTFKSNILHTMYVDNQDTLWMADKYTGIYKLHINSLNYTSQNIALHTLCINEIDEKGFLFSAQMVVSKVQHLYHRYANGTIRNLEFSKKYPVHLWFNGNPPGFQAIRLKDSSFVIGVHSTLLRIKNDSIIEQRDVKSHIHCLYEDKSGNVWVGLNTNGVLCFNAGNAMLFNKTPAVYLPHKSISCILQDNEGGYWFSTLESGIYYTPTLKYISYTLTDSKYDYKITAIQPYSKNSCLFITYSGDIYEIKNNSVLPKILYKDKGYKFHSLFKDKRNNFWFAVSKTANTLGVIHSDPHFKIIRKYNFLGLANSFYEDRDNIWIGNTRLVKIDLNTVKLTDYELNLTPGVGRLRISGVSGRDNLLYMCCTNGLWTFDGKEYKHETVRNPLLKTRMTAIVKDKSGNLWLASKGSGVIVYTADKKVYQISEKEGLANALCNTICIDSNHVVWVGTNNGLSRISKADFIKREYEIHNYNISHGLPSNQINELAAQGDYLWLSTNKAIAKFKPLDILDNNVSPPVYISSVAVNNKINKLQAAYTLPYDKNTIEFSYVGLAYKNAGKIRYKYCLKGLDTSWIYTPNTSVRFADLSPGNYTFKVVAANNDGYWSSSPAYVSFSIIPPFWLTWWFISASFALCLWGVIILIRYRLKIIKAKESEHIERNKHIAYLELKALKARMNPHFIFNTISSIQHYVIKNNPDKAYDYFSKYTLLMRKVFDYSSEQSITIDEELQTLKLYIELEALRFENRFSYTLHVSEAIDIEFEKIPPLLIQPYVENAIWHGLMNKSSGEALLNVSLTYHSTTTLKCIIEDNGIGRAEAGRLKSKNVINHKSGGMKTTEERLELLNMMANNAFSLKVSDLLGENNQAAGTRVELYIPIQ